jgi:hypothetical protein
MLWETMKDLPQVFVSYPNFRDWRGRPALERSFEDVALYNGFGNGTLTGMGNAERVPLGLASGNLFDLLGVRPGLGRVFTERDDQVGAERVAVISDAFWRRRFADDSSVIGKTLMLDGMSYTIVGVLPRRVRLATCEIWIPRALRQHRTLRGPDEPSRHHRRRSTQAGSDAGADAGRSRRHVRATAGRIPEGECQHRRVRFVFH